MEAHEMDDMTWAIGMPSALAMVEARRASPHYARPRSPEKDADIYILIQKHLKAALDRKASGFIWVPATDARPFGVQVSKPVPWEPTHKLLGTYIERVKCQLQLVTDGPYKTFTLLVDEEGLLRSPVRQNGVLGMMTGRQAIASDFLICFGRTGWGA